MQRRFRALGLGLLALLVLAPAASAAHHKPAPQAKPVKGILLSLGDSYSVGWQELPGGGQGSTHNGPADQLVPLAAARGWHLKLVNLGCGGATTTSMLTASALGCVPQALAPGATNYPNKSQTQAAVDFIKSHRNQVKVVTRLHRRQRRRRLPDPARSHRVRQGEHARGDQELDQDRQAAACRGR